MKCVEIEPRNPKMKEIRQMMIRGMIGATLWVSVEMERWRIMGTRRLSMLSDGLEDYRCCLN